jgi:hypothetical protein
VADEVFITNVASNSALVFDRARCHLKLEAAAAKSFRSNVQPQNGTGPYIPGNIITINIPTRNNLLLAAAESYLKIDFVLANTSGGAVSARWDSSGAHGLIQRIRVYHGSNLLEDIEN